MKNKGRLYSLDVDGDRRERGRPRCAKAGVDNVQRQTVQADIICHVPVGINGANTGIGRSIVV